MTISLYPIDAARGIYSFRPQPGAEPARVRVPAGSVLREVKSVGAVLFVPGEDPCVKGGWSANQVMAEAKSGGRFKLVKTNDRERVTGSGKLAGVVG